jgi:hypothetical protein
VWIIENAPGYRTPRTEEVDWSLFPIAEAHQEMISHEERCSRFRLRIPLAA